MFSVLSMDHSGVATSKWSMRKKENNAGKSSTLPSGTLKVASRRDETQGRTDCKGRHGFHSKTNITLGKFQFLQMSFQN